MILQIIWSRPLKWKFDYNRQSDARDLSCCAVENYVIICGWCLISSYNLTYGIQLVAHIALAICYLSWIDGWFSCCMYRKEKTKTIIWERILIRSCSVSNINLLWFRLNKFEWHQICTTILPNKPTLIAPFCLPNPICCWYLIIILNTKSHLFSSKAPLSSHIQPMLEWGITVIYIKT